MSRVSFTQNENFSAIAENSTTSVSDDELRSHLLKQFNNIVSRWQESIIHIDNDRLHKVCSLIEWNDEYINAKSDGGVDAQQLDRLLTHMLFLNSLDKSINIQSCRKYNEADESASPYSEWEYTVMKSKKRKTEKTGGYAFDSFMEVLTDNAQLKKVYKQNGSFIARDEPELSVIVSEAMETIIDWCRKDNNKNTYINKAAETRKTKIKEFYETLRETVNEIESSNNNMHGEKKLTSYKLAVELNKRDVKTYSKSGQWMPNMADKLRAYIASNEPKSANF